MGMSAFHDPVDAVTALPAVRADVGARTDDSRLVQALRAGDEQAFGDLVERYHAAMVRLAILYVSDRAVAEEVAQDAWLGVLRGIDRFEPRATLKTWIFQILVNRAKTSARREGRSVPFSSLNDTAAGDDGPAVEPGRFLEADTAALPAGWWSTGPGGFGVTAEQAALSAEARAIVADALATLAPGQREVMTLRDVEGWTAAEVCDVLGLSDGNQRVLLHRARSRVRSALERYFKGM